MGSLDLLQLLERGGKKHLHFVHPKQQCEIHRKSTIVVHGVNSQQWLFLVHRAALQVAGLCLWVALCSAGTASAKENTGAGHCQGNGFCVLYGGSTQWITLA